MSAVATLEALVPRDDVVTIRQRFHENGHVGVENVFDSTTAQQAYNELCGIRGSSHVPGGIGELRHTITNFGPTSSRPNLTNVLSNIGALAEQCDRKIWPLRTGSVIQVIHMSPGAEGAVHVDNEDIIEAVGIANFKGNSILKLAGVTYHVDVGTVILQDSYRKFLHQGIAGSDGERAGIALARLKPRQRRRT